MDTQQKKDFIINFIYYGIVAVIVFLSFKHIVPVLVPFIIAFLIAFCLKKPIDKTQKFLHLNHKLTAVIVLLLFYIIIGSLVTGVIVAGINMLKDLVNQIPGIYSNTIEPLLDMGYQTIIKDLEEMSPETKETIFEVVTASYEYLRSFLSSLTSLIVTLVSHVISAVPKLFMSTILMLISSFFFVLDYDVIINFINRNIIHKYAIFQEVQTFVKDKLMVIGKSYLIIISITFMELLIALSILQVDNVVVLAIAIALFDILPIFGIGGILIPWGIIALISKNYFLGFGLLITYVVMTVLRQIIEPKLVGTSLGLHPIVTLMTMLVGVRFFGFIGMLGLPIFTSFLLYKYHLNKAQKQIQNA